MESPVSNYVSAKSVSTESIDDFQHSTPPTSDEERRVGPSRAHFQRRYREIKPLAAGGNGETFFAIPKKAADSICRNLDAYKTQQEFFDALRAKIVVAKFPKRGRGVEDELINEINFLANVLPIESDDSANRPITELLDYHSRHDVQWHTTALAKGGDFYHLIKKNRQDLTLGLRWHLALQIAGAMAFLHYGKTNLLSSENGDGQGWPTVHHGDLHSGNIFLTSSSEGSYHDFPDLKLADFGRAYKHVKVESPNLGVFTAQPTPAVRSEMLVTFQQRQLVDFRSAGVTILGMALAYHHGKVCSRSWHCRSDCGKCPRADCEECIAIGKRVGKFEGLGPNEKLYIGHAQDFINFQGPMAEDPRKEGLEFLKEFAKIAAEQRDKHYVPLSAEARNRLNAEKVSDADIDRALALNII